jgi:acetolactate synthase-1/2/3 large subunit
LPTAWQILHNAQRAGSPVLNMVGDHATDHLQHDAPLTSDIKGMATPVSRSFRVSDSAAGLAQTGLEALADSLSHNGTISTFVVPADHAWTDIDELPSAMPETPLAKISDTTISEIAAQLQSASSSCLFMGGRTLREDALHHGRPHSGRNRLPSGDRDLLCEASERCWARAYRAFGLLLARPRPSSLAGYRLAGAGRDQGAGLLFRLIRISPASWHPKQRLKCTLVDRDSDALDALKRLATTSMRPPRLRS